ncbi:LamG-like jellyroll fold domain-containing protein [Chengkuizengella axinellae]|uniref:LamG-like jellyroll fold domain-containing protein n=1 Tax=Chengkuizengella axinellae TaxID=3064388 RepID=A0ABT9IWF1_9BACL|nr:LamG-like jellyroll fold domain-containing protein [Chengkuizengella sp. 2205SS18-9]MDP5273685.1 LamG-like jellyroll fold domain-containing protein [Chengkuizengella sp. 2205SS18-9]
MSQAHKKSKLLLKEQLIPVDFQTFHMNCHRDASAIYRGDVAMPTSELYTLREEEGVFGGNAIAIEEATENIISSQSIDGHGSSWVKQSETFQGQDVYKNTVTNPNTGNNFGFRSGTNYVLQPTDTHITLNFWIKLITDPGTMYGYVMVHYNNGDFIDVIKHSWSYSPNPFNKTDYIYKWTKVTSTVQLNSLSGRTPSHIDAWYVYKDNASEGEMDISMIQIEAKSFPTSFVHGTRSIGELTYPLVVDPNYFTINFWLKAHENYGDFYINLYVPDHDNRVYFRPNNATSITGGKVIGGSINSTSSLTIDSIYDWNMYTIVSNFEYMSVYQNGKLLAEANVGLLSGSSTDIIFNDYSRMNFLIDELRIDPVTYSAEEIESWYIFMKPFINPYDYRAYV